MVNDPLDNQTAPVVTGQAVKTEVKEAVAPAPVSTQTTPTDKGAVTGQPGFDVQRSYEELRKEFTRRTQYEAELQKKLSAIEESNKNLAESLAKATEEPFNPEQFMETFKSQGPKALEPYLDKRLKSLVEKYDKTIDTLQSERIQDRTRIEVLIRRADEANFPDFERLENAMRDLAASENCPVDLNRPIPEVLDTLYKLVREQHSGEAVIAAEQLGKSKAEAQLAKEAATAVAGGGKPSGTVTPGDMKNMKLDDLEKLVIQMHGIADRD